MNLIRPRQLVEGFWLRKVSDVYDMADGPVAREGLHEDSHGFFGGDSVYSMYLQKGSLGSDVKVSGIEMSGGNCIQLVNQVR